MKPCCCLLGSGSSNPGVVPSSLDGNNLAEASTAECTESRGEREGALFLSNKKCKEYSDGRQSDADVKGNTINSGKSNSNQGLNVEPWETNAEIPEKSFFSGASCLLTVGNMDYAVQPPSQESSLLQPKSGLRNEDLSRSEEPAKSSFSSEEMGLLKSKLMQTIFTQEAFVGDSGSATKDTKPLANANSPSNVSSLSGVSEVGKWQKEALEKAQQAMIRAHRQQLDEMASLCFKEECLINQMSATDFQNFITKLDEILVLKSKCIQTMRAQLQLYLASPSADTSLQTPPPV